MATTDLKLDDPGSLPRPGPIGQLARFGFGIVSLWQVVRLWNIRSDLVAGGADVIVIWNGLVIGLFLISYVVNIGFSRSWKKRPLIISAAAFAAVASYGYLTTGYAVTNTLIRVIWAWEFYLFAHLGAAFVLSGVIRTPGCEMRAFHDLFSIITGIETKEHYCPVGPLHPIDQWEARMRKRSKSSGD
jgi:hypothetical protein